MNAQKQIRSRSISQLRSLLVADVDSCVSRVITTWYPSASSLSRIRFDTSNVSTYSGLPVATPRVPDDTFGFFSEEPGPTDSN